MDGVCLDEDNAERRSGARLILRAAQESDVAALVALADNSRIAQNLATMPYPYGPADARAWIRRGAALGAGEAAFVIQLNDRAQRVIGCAGYGVLDHQEPDIGYWIGEPFWGRGYATEAAHLVVDHAFMIAGLRRLRASCRVPNRPSRRVLEKCGFQFCGDGMLYSRYHNAAVPVHEFRLDRKTWVSLKAWGAADMLREGAA